MVSVRHIGKGEEVFNTYGQMANWQLLHMYGFAEPFPMNSNDTADIQMSSVYKAAVQGVTLKRGTNLAYWNTFRDVFLLHLQWHKMKQINVS